MGIELLPEKPTRGAELACARWLQECLLLGWGKSQLDLFERLWWKYHDTRGNLVQVPETDASRSTPALTYFGRLILDEGTPTERSMTGTFVYATDLGAGSEGDVPAPPLAGTLRALVAELRALCQDTSTSCPDRCETYRCSTCAIADKLAALAAAASPPGAADAREPQARVGPCEKLDTGKTMGYMHRWSADRCQCGALPPFADSVISNVPVAPAAPRDTPQTRLEMLRWHLTEVQRLGGSPRAVTAVRMAIADEMAAPRAEKET